MISRRTRSLLVPIAIVVAVAAGVWWFVFREPAEERATRHLQAAASAMRQQDFDTAERNLNAALDLVPNNGVLLHNLGVLYLRQNRLPEARAAFEHAVSTHGPQANEVMAEDLFQLATISYLEKKWTQAADELERSIAAHPQRAQLHARLMDLQLSRLEAPAAADSSAARLLRLCGRSAANLEAVAYIYYQNNVWQHSETLAREATALADSQVSAHALVARSLWRRGTVADGLRYLEPLLARYPRAAELWVAQGAMLLDDGRRQAALEAADRALVVAPDDMEAHDLRRHALANLGRLEEALREIEITRRLTQDAGRQRLLQRDEARLRALLGAATPGGGAAAADTNVAGGGAVP